VMLYFNDEGVLVKDELIDPDSEFRKIVRRSNGMFDVVSRIDTSRAIWLFNSNGKKSNIHKNTGFYVLYGPELVGPATFNMRKYISYYVGYAGCTNTINTRLGRFIAHLKGENTENETHQAANRLREILSFYDMRAPIIMSNSLRVKVYPYHIDEWMERAKYAKEHDAWRSIEIPFIKHFRPKLNKKVY